MSMIIDWGEEQVTGLGKMGLARIVAEVGDDGFVTRELGFDVDGRLVHRFPGTGPDGTYGLFDLTPIAPSKSGDLPQEQFERLWADAKEA